MNDTSLLDAFADLDSAAVSDALDGLGKPSGIGGIIPVTGVSKIVGFAVTVELEPYTPGPSGPHIGSTAVASAGGNDVIVVANNGRTDVSCWGGLLSLGASLRGVRGTIADGCCRDLGEARELGYPVFSRGGIPATARGRLQQKSTGMPVEIAGVWVAPGDIVLADETGTVFVPREHAAEILAKAQAITARERSIAQDLRNGIALPDTMHDARLAGSEGK
ncbi:RraA family protein [Rhodococcus sp. B10]|uniref:RraA family protein n=1 Tax=Rhodococcus sp. B10 TaxID=2695876 RepID=UPI001430BEBA|nr:RraA family protein [Rhodococcus sp. B10]NIL77874.1 4-hydroxy-4-methyl-2-oxoglutarate aldolase/4-carboxy-4-hydroxy-2-oxoadipate aldolase [Rhodococcus sp. B10]